MCQPSFMQLGSVPEGANSWSFPRVMGKQRANALLLASEQLNAREMYDAGLITKVIESRVWRVSGRRWSRSRSGLGGTVQIV